MCEKKVYQAPQIVDLGSHREFVQRLQIGTINDGVILNLPGGGMVIGTASI